MEFAGQLRHKWGSAGMNHGWGFSNIQWEGTLEADKLHDEGSKGASPAADTGARKQACSWLLEAQKLSSAGSSTKEALMTQADSLIQQQLRTGLAIYGNFLRQVSSASGGKWSMLDSSRDYGSLLGVGESQELKVKARNTNVSGVRAPVIVRASQEESAVARRAVLGGLAGSVALLSGVRPSEAAFGEAARVFGSKATNSTGFVPYSGEGFALLLPSKYNPSKEKEFPGTALRYEDNGDAVNSIAVIVRSTTKNSIEEYGSPDKFLEENKNLLGAQVFKGETLSEGGFAPNKVSVASLLDVQQAKDKKGKSYYKYEILTRTADGDEGGRHQLITAAVGNGNLYILKVQVGDKRWFKGADAGAKGAWNSFVVA